MIEIIDLAVLVHRQELSTLVVILSFIYSFILCNWNFTLLCNECMHTHTALYYWGEAPLVRSVFVCLYVRLSVYVGLTIFKVNKLLTLILESMCSAIHGQASPPQCSTFFLVSIFIVITVVWSIVPAQVNVGVM